LGWSSAGHKPETAGVLLLNPVGFAWGWQGDGMARLGNPGSEENPCQKSLFSAMYQNGLFFIQIRLYIH